MQKRIRYYNGFSVMTLSFEGKTTIMRKLCENIIWLGNPNLL